MRIMSMPVDKGGCGNYRVRQPLAMLKKYTKHDTYIIEKESDEMDDILKALPTVDVIVVRQGVPIQDTKSRFNEVMADLSRHYKREVKMKAKWVMDIDDNMELISPYSAHYQTEGIEEYYDRNAKKWLWKDGVGGFDLEHNRLKLNQAKESLKDADMVTVTTQKLAEFASRFNSNVKVLPNCINFEKWWRLRLRTNRQLRVGWSGGISHYEDWYTIKHTLNRLLRKYKFKLVIAGDYFKGIIDDDLQYLVETHDWVDFSGHSYRMMCLSLDLAIIPLADLPFNHYKSPVKWYEMSAMRVPSVVAAIEPYVAEIRDGETVWGYLDATSFEKAVSTALQRPDLRKQYGENAHDWVLKNRNAKKNVKMWADAYESLL
jgi:glycosyltransferase involved in cell wall biosynthesis